MSCCDPCQTGLHLLAALLDAVSEFRILPIVERGRCGDESQIVSAERADVISRPPDVDGRANERQGHWHSHAANRFRETHDVGLDVRPFKAEERPGATTA